MFEDSRSVASLESRLTLQSPRPEPEPFSADVRTAASAARGQRFGCARAPGFLAAVMLMAMAAGCNDSSPGASLPAPSKTVSQSSSNELLRSALSLLREEEQGGNLFVQGQQQERSFGRVRELLNQWIQTGGATREQLALEDGVRTRLSQFLKPAELADLEADRFTKGDAEHLRSCFVLRDVAGQAQGDAAQSLDRARAIFDWIGRNIHPLDEAHDRGHLPLGPYYTLLTGRGSDQERAWLMIALLRQLKIDAIVVAHADQEKETRYIPWAVGVLESGDLHLFDFDRGRPVLDPNGEGLVTLRAAIARPDLLRSAWDGERPLDPRRPLVFLESDPVYWAPRMRLLGGKLAGDQAAVLSYDFEDLVRRVAETAGEPLEDLVRLWPMPLEVWRQARADDPNYEQHKLLQLGPFAVFPVFVNTRLGQLRGDWEQAIPALQTVNVAKAQAANLSSLNKQFLDQAAEASTYWVGLCQYERQQYALAADWFSRYLERFGSEGRWAPGARTLLEEARAKSDSNESTARKSDS